MNAVLDIGNTLIKVGIFDENKLLKTKRASKLSQAIKLIEEASIENLIISSVKGDPHPYMNKIKVKGKSMVLDYGTLLPVKIDYKTPKTLGVDRIAACVGALKRHPGINCLVIDVGTCITFDFLNSAGHFKGGSISPGTSLRLKALHDYTANLPLIKKIDDEFDLIGNTTSGAMLSGVVGGIREEIRGIIRLYAHKFRNLQIIFTGGEAHFYAKELNTPLEIAPNLVLEGLNKILMYNVQD